MVGRNCLFSQVSTKLAPSGAVSSTVSITENFLGPISASLVLLNQTWTRAPICSEPPLLGAAGRRAL